jgi:hypothetical protein
MSASAFASERGDAAFELGLARFQAADYAAAIVSLLEAHSEDPSDPDTALLLAIAYYRTARYDAASPLFAQAERMGDVETQNSARIFLGLLAEARGEEDQARLFYGLVASSGAVDLTATARRLLDPTDRWFVVAVVRPEVDSNVALLPGTAAKNNQASADADLLLLVRGAVQPVEGIPVSLDETATYRKQAQLTEFDMLALTSGATYLHVGSVHRASVAYHLEVSTLGGTRYLVGHVGELALRRAMSPCVALAARYTFADRAYAAADYAGYSGITHAAAAELTWTRRSFQLDVSYLFDRESTDDPALSAIGNGVRGAAQFQPSKTLDLRGSLTTTYRRFDAASAGRRDLRLQGEVSVYHDLSGIWGLVVGGAFVRNVSSNVDFDYPKWTVFAGLVAALSS